MLALHEPLAGQTGAVEELAVEAFLERSHRHVATVGARIGVVEGCGAIDQVALPPILPLPHRMEGQVHRLQQRAAIGHRGVDHLAFAGLAGMQHRSQHAHREQHGAATEVGHQVERRHRAAFGSTDGVQGPRQREVVQVVTRGVRERAALPPPGHATVDQPRVARQAGLGAQAQALHHTGAEALDQHVGRAHQAQGGRTALGPTEVERHRAAPALQHVAGRIEQRRLGAAAGPVDAQHVGAQVGQQHAAERRRPHGRELDHAHAAQRTGARARCRHDRPPQLRVETGGIQAVPNAAFRFLPTRS